MKTIRFLFLFALLGTFANNSIAQDGIDPEFGIQLATYSSQKALNANLPVLNALNSGSDYHLFMSHQVGNKIKVYLVDKYGYFYPSSEMNDALDAVKANKGFEKAFLKSILNDRGNFNPLLVNTVTNPYDNSDELTSKGGSTNTKTAEKKYRVQLGVFSQLQSPQHLAKSYGLTKWEEANIDRVVSHDFTKVKDEVCRRYYYGSYTSKSKARQAKRKLEKKTGRKLALVKR